MKGTELRIGNIVSLKDETGTFTVSEIHYGGIYFLEKDKNGDSSRVLDYINPIPLTEEWLLRFGFEKYQWCDDCAYVPFLGRHLMVRLYNGKWSVFKTKVTIQNGKQGMVGRTDIVLSGLIQYVHQLQNLYYALCSKELTIKEP